MSRNLSQLVRVPLREAWRHEASDFTPWLAEEENPDLLAEALGIDELEPIGRADLLGRLPRPRRRKRRV